VDKQLHIPDFIVAGAAKCGTSALAHFLSQVPGIYMSENKEPRFFTRIKGDMEKGIAGDGPRLSGNYNKGFAWYEKLFENANQGQLKAEASTVYFCNEDAADLIYKSNPSVKLIFMLRHPVKRMYSHYWQEYKLGFDFPPFEEMMNTKNPRFNYYKRISSYKQNLSRFLKFFSLNQIHLVIQEEFEKDTQTEFGNILDFLQIEQTEINFDKRINEQVIPKNRRIARALTTLQASPLKKIIPNSLIRSAGKIRAQLFSANAKAFKYPPLPQNIYELLKKDFEEDIDFVEQLLKREITVWKQN
jgi:hypothetical protein